MKQRLTAEVTAEGFTLERHPDEAEDVVILNVCV